MFFYAGHGLQVAGQNYLVPIDAKAESEDALDWEMLKVEIVHRAMERSTNTNILFLDACRDNPLARNLARGMGTRSSYVGRGLATIESGVGTLISFSTQPGNVALDGAGRNSPFAGSLVKRIATSSDDLSALLIDVRNDVCRETQNAQVPWEHSALTGRFYFTPPKNSVPGGSTTSTPSQLGEAAQTWAAIKDTQDVRTLDAFRRQYGSSNPLFDRLAEARIEELRKLGSASVSTSPGAEGYLVEKLASVTGPTLSTLTVAIDVSKPEPAIAACARHCDAYSTSCAAFDLSLVYGKCTLYSKVERKGSLGGFISGVKMAK